MSTKKAQVAFTDLFFSLSVFLIVLVFFAITWSLYSVRLFDSMDQKNLELAAFQITDLLVKTSGDPYNWEQSPSEVITLGLASEDRVLSAQKISAFNNLTYTKTKTLLNIDRYDYYLLIKTGSAILYESNTTPTGKTISLRRNILYEHENATLDFILWE